MRSDKSDSFTCKLHHACLYSPAAEHHRPLAGTHFTVPQRVEGWVDLGGWLHTEIKCRLRESNADTVTHPSTSRAQRRLTSLVETNALPLRQTNTRLLEKLMKYDIITRSYCNRCHASMGGATMGAGGQYPPPYKGEGDRGSTEVTKSISFNTEFILWSSCNYSQASVIFLANTFPVQFIKYVLLLQSRYDTCAQNLTKWPAYIWRTAQKRKNKEKQTE